MLKKRIYAIITVLLLSAVTLAGCGESYEVVDRSSRRKNERSSENKDDRDSSKKDRDWEDFSSVAVDKRGQENSSNALEDERAQENSSNNSENEPTQENTSDISEDEPTRENSSDISEGEPTPENASNASEDEQNQTNTPAANDAEAYADDIKAMLALYAVEDISDDDPEKMLSELQNLINGMNVKTAEALVIKSDLQELVDILNSLVSVLNIMDDPSALWNLDLDVLNAFNKIDKLSKAIEDHAEAFINAAEASGIDEDTLKEIEEMAASMRSLGF